MKLVRIFGLPGVARPRNIRRPQGARLPRVSVAPDDDTAGVRAGARQSSGARPSSSRSSSPGAGGAPGSAAACRSRGRQRWRLSCPRRSDFSMAASTTSGLIISMNGLRSRSLLGHVDAPRAMMPSHVANFRRRDSRQPSRMLRQSPCRMIFRHGGSESDPFNVRPAPACRPGPRGRPRARSRPPPGPGRCAARASAPRASSSSARVFAAVARRHHQRRGAVGRRRLDRGAAVEQQGHAPWARGRWRRSAAASSPRG